MVKSHLPDALEYPSKFISVFLHQDTDEMISKFSTIHDMLVMRCENSGNKASNKAKYRKETIKIRDNWIELEGNELRGRFNPDDFFRPAFLQYAICAFCYEVW